MRISQFPRHDISLARQQAFAGFPQHGLMVLGKQSLLPACAQKEKMNEIGNLPRVILFSLSTSFGLPPILNCPKNYMGAMYSDIRYTFLPVVSTREVAINQILGGQKGKKNHRFA